MLQWAEVSSFCVGTWLWKSAGERF